MVKPGSSGLTPATKSLRINQQSPHDANKENIPPGGRVLRSAKKVLESVDQNSSRDARSTRRSLFGQQQQPVQQGEKREMKKDKESPRKRAATSVARDEASPNKKSPGRRPLRVASAAATERILMCNETTPKQKVFRAPKLEFDNVDTTELRRGRSKSRAPDTKSVPASLAAFSQKAARQRTPEESDDEEEEERGKSKPAAPAAAGRPTTRAASVARGVSATPRRSTRLGSVGRGGEDVEMEWEPLQQETQQLRRSDRTPARGGKEGRERKEVEKKEVEKTRDGVEYTPMEKLRPSVRLTLRKVGEGAGGGGEWKTRTMKTPQTEGRLRRTARVMPSQQQRDASYEPVGDANLEESESEEEEEEEEETSEESEGEEEEEEERRPRRTPARGKAAATAAARTPATAARAASAARGGKGGAKTRFVGGYKVEEEVEDRIDLSKAPPTLAAALERLAMYRCPKGTLLCREAECAQIRQFLRAAISPNGMSQACYISGVPGTGKTASVMAMVDELAAASCLTASSRCPFVFIQVNAMYHSDAKQLFSDIWQKYEAQTTGEGRRLAGNTARKRLNALFGTVDRTRPPVLMLVDELDQLNTKKQELIYDIFNWTALDAARVSVISIANTLDLPERMLSQRICSRLGMNRIVFQPYTHDEIERIIVAKLGGKKGRGEEVIEKDAVQLAARKVAAISGDLRKATDILRVAIERAIRKGEERLTMMQVNDSIRAASSTLLVAAVNSLVNHQLFLFEAAVDIIRTRDVEDFSLFDLVEKYEAIAMMGHEKEPMGDDWVWRETMRLTSMGLIAFTNPNEKARFRRRARLVPAVHDAVSAIKITTEKRTAAAAAAAGERVAARMPVVSCRMVRAAA